MIKKILLVDDDKMQLDKLRRYVSIYTPLEVMLAENTKEGIEIAIKNKPEAIITDKDMLDGTGNDLAIAVKKHYDAFIVGMTGGDPKDFNEQFIDLRLSKRISDEHYALLINCIVEGSNPKKDFEVRTKGYYETIIPQLNEALLQYQAIDILIQGYMIAKKNQSQNVMSSESDAHRLNNEIVNSILNIDEISIDVNEIHKKQSKLIKQLSEYSIEFKDEKIQDKINSALFFVTDYRVESFIEDLSKRDMIAIEQKKDYEVFTKLYHDLLQSI
ncbi:MAG: two-component system response regulator [Candidatus Woesearchaeota archaeon]